MSSSRPQVRFSLKFLRVRRDPDSFSSGGFAPLQGFLPQIPPVPESTSTSHGLSCRSAYPFRRDPHTPRQSQVRVRGRIQGFSPSLRVTPSSALRVYFASLTPIGSPFRGFHLSRSSTDSSPVTCRLAVLRELRILLPKKQDSRRTHTHRSGHYVPFSTSRPCSP